MCICATGCKPRLFSAFFDRVFFCRVTEPQKTYILHHEYAHLARGDQFWKPLGFTILSIYWFHPLVWVSYILFCRDMELACDERVVRDLSLADKIAYSETLLLCSVRKKSVAACPLSFAEVGVKTRVKSVLRYKKPLVSVVVLSCIAVLAVAGFFLTEPKTQEAPVAELSAEPVAEVTVPVTESVTEPVTESVTEAATEPETEEATTKKKTAKTTTTKAETTTESNKPIRVSDPFDPEDYTITQKPGYHASLLPTSSGGYGTTAPSQIIWDYGTLRPDQNGHLPDVAYGGR